MGSRRLRIAHHTEYHYREEVSFGPHRAMTRPREGHDTRIVAGRLRIEPEAEIRWHRDVYGNSIASIEFLAPGRRLLVHSEVDVDLFDDPPVDCAIDARAATHPFQYAAEEQAEIVPYRLPSYPHDWSALLDWLGGPEAIREPRPTSELLSDLNRRIFETLKYEAREEPGVRTPCRTLELGSGSCRDYAVLMMEAARHLGFAARFATGYIQLREGQHGATHAWTEIYLPGAGWRGYDPTNNKLAGLEHVATGVSRDQERAAPLSGTWSGPADAFERMEVSVRVVAL